MPENAKPPADQPLTATATPPAGEETGKVPAKPPKLKLVRDSFTIPRPEYAAIEVLKARALKLERSVKKSELLRAGLLLLSGLGDAALLRAIEAVPQVKTGRPKKAKEKTEAASKAAKT